MSTYSMTVAGLQRELPICKVTDDLYIGAFICFGDAELTEASTALRPLGGSGPGAAPAGAGGVQHRRL